MDLFWEINRPSLMKEMKKMSMFKILDIFQRYEK